MVISTVMHKRIEKRVFAGQSGPLVETGGVGVGRAPVCIGVSSENDDGGAAGPTDFLFQTA